MHTTSDDAAADSRAALIKSITMVFLVFTWLSVLARTWVRAMVIRNYGWDDAVMLLAMVCHLFFVAASLDVRY
jgi:hypothetical protein